MIGYFSGKAKEKIMSSNKRRRKPEFELILEQCVANYYGDNTIPKQFLNFPRKFFYWSHVTTFQKLYNKHSKLAEF